MNGETASTSCAINPKATDSSAILALVARAATQGVLVLGAGVTGLAAVRLFREAGLPVAVVDEKPLSEERAKLFEGVEVHAPFEAGPSALLRLQPERFAFALASPGLNPRGKLLQALQRCAISVVNEIDLATPFLGMPQIAVTGTNGKTTAVTLLNDFLLESGFDSRLIGNVGFPFLSHVPEAPLREPSRQLELAALAKVTWVAEVSSYQLETAQCFAPKIAVLLNVDDDHLERHGSLEGYLAAKIRIFANQNPKTDWAIINADEWWWPKIAERVPARHMPFGVLTADRMNARDGSWYDQSANEIRFQREGVVEQYSLRDSKLLGRHNKLNVAACIAAARLLGCTEESLQKVLSRFTPLEHRIEHAGTVRGVTYINDSKGTNVSAVVVAIDTMTHEFPHAKIILLVGGMIKEGSWEPIRKKLSQCLAVVAFGGNREEVLERLQLQAPGTDSLLVVNVPTLDEAVRSAAAIAKSGDVVLLSPACASFDAFTDYNHRGRHFKSLVARL